MIKEIIKTESISNLELDIEDLYSKQTVRLLKYSKGQYYTIIEYNGLNQATIKACIQVYAPDLQRELITLLKISNEPGMNLSMLREMLAARIEDL